MSIESVSTRDFTLPVIPTIAVKVETTHMVFNFMEGAGYLRQLFVDTDGNVISARFLQVLGVKYSLVETAIKAKIQRVVDDIELDAAEIDGVSIVQISRNDFFRQLEKQSV